MLSPPYPDARELISARDAIGLPSFLGASLLLHKTIGKCRPSRLSSLSNWLAETGDSLGPPNNHSIPILLASQQLIVTDRDLSLEPSVEGHDTEIPGSHGLNRAGH